MALGHCWQVSFQVSRRPTCSPTAFHDPTRRKARVSAHFKELLPRPNMSIQTHQTPPSRTKTREHMLSSLLEPLCRVFNKGTTETLSGQRP